MNWLKLNGSVIHIPLWIFIAKELEILFRLFGEEIASPPAETWFIASFIEWFGVLYGILLPLILVRAWEQLDDIDREFDKEADIVKIFYKDLTYFSSLSDIAGVGKRMVRHLHRYVYHVTNNYQNEIKELGEDKRVGDQILEDIREEFKELVQPKVMKQEVNGFLTKELFDKLNEIIDVRGDRISLASQRLFESLRIVALITSIIFLVPFYFAGLTGLHFLDVVLIVSVTFLVIYIYMLVEDFDQPFDGGKRVNDESWKNLLTEMDTKEGRISIVKE